MLSQWPSHPTDHRWTSLPERLDLFSGHASRVVFVDAEAHTDRILLICTLRHHGERKHAKSRQGLSLFAGLLSVQTASVLKGGYGESGGE